jgi:type I restriction enzyme R subunit
LKSLNFEFLRPEWAELASLAGFAEQYAYADPAGGLVKLRSFGEQVVEIAYEKFSLPRPPQARLIELLSEDSFKQAVPRVVVNIIDAIRIHGNKAAHGAEGNTRTVLWLLKEAHRLGQWLYLTFTGKAPASIPAYQEPTPEQVSGKSKAELKREKAAILQRLASQEAQMQKLLDDLATARREATAAKATEGELRARLQAAQTSVSVLDFNEEETRRMLIDTQLQSAGWTVGPGLRSTASVGKEVEVCDQPTDSGKGYADYVLYDEGSGKPLAVVEAKKTAVDPEAGRTQAKCYADGLEKQHDQRPVIFYTNGFDTWIWDDAGRCTPRKLYGFYSKDSLEYLIRLRNQRQELTQVIPNKEIAGRLYQMRAITEVLERFQNRRRKTLIVQATGTGKTRVAISICEALIRAGWAKRILFLCDRRELRKQAHNAFKAFLPDEPRVYVTTQTYKEREHRIYLATYPAMMKCFETFDVGFFDLIIADESHRSIYNRYRDLFKYFDALQVGLTATPRKDLITHNTYELFDCEDNDPTAFYGYDDAINDLPPWLSPFEVHTYTTPFLREGMKYDRMTPDQRRQLEDDEIQPEAIQYEQRQVDKHVFNKDTNRRILRNLMENGIKVAGCSRLGKSIIFARNHNHAVLLQTLFDEMYPQYGGNFCRVIDNYDPRAEELIDDLKGEGKNPELTIGISVDMLDTGIDIPEVVNLVFAKPIYSYIKFWQMIGRGTRLCKDLFGPGLDKKKFLIFDHWGNFEYFDEHYTEAETNGNNKSVQQVLFEERIRLAEAARTAQDHEAFELACDLLLQDVRDLPDTAIAIRDKWREVKTVQQDGVVKRFDAATKSMLLTTIAPLMQWRNITGHLPAYECDLICCRLQAALIKGSSCFNDLRDELVARVSDLQINLNPVKEKVAAIDRVKSGAFWTAPTVAGIEDARRELRGIMKYRGRTSGGTPLPPKVLDIAEDESLVERRQYRPKLAGLELIEYRSRVQSVLTQLIDTTPPLQKIKAGQPVSKEELDKLTAIVLAQEPDLDLTDLLEYYPETAGNLAVAIRSIIGLNAEIVNERFTTFAQQHKLNSTQLRFLDLLKNYIRDFGAIELDQLYETPFTSLDKDGLDGVFPDEQQAEEIIALVESFSISPGGAAN